MSNFHKQEAFMMDIAARVAQQSYDSSTKVGCVISKGDRILGYGYNGTPAGFDNECKNQEGRTLPTVIHAEINALAKIARSHSSSEGAILYTTLSPCVHCALSIIQSGISTVVYRDLFRLSPHEGIAVLQEAGVTIRQYSKD